MLVREFANRAGIRVLIRPRPAVPVRTRRILPGKVLPQTQKQATLLEREAAFSFEFREGCYASAITAEVKLTVEDGKDGHLEFRDALVIDLPSPPTPAQV